MTTKTYFKEWRKKSGLTQAEIGERLGPGWGQTKISRIETGDVDTKVEDLAIAASLFGCSLAEIIAIDPYSDIDRDLWMFFQELRGCPAEIQRSVLDSAKPIIALASRGSSQSGS